MHGNMTLPCILNKTAVAFSTEQYYLIFQTICYRIIKALISAKAQNDMHHILWVLQFTLGQSVIYLLTCLLPLTETVNHFGNSCLSLK